MRVILVVNDLRRGGGAQARSVRATLLLAELKAETFVTGDPLVAKYEDWLFEGLPPVVPTLYLIDEDDNAQTALKVLEDPRLLTDFIREAGGKVAPDKLKFHQSAGDQVV